MPSRPWGGSLTLGSIKMCFFYSWFGSIGLLAGVSIGGKTKTEAWASSDVSHLVADKNIRYDIQEEWYRHENGRQDQTGVRRGAPAPPPRPSRQIDHRHCPDELLRSCGVDDPAIGRHGTPNWCSGYPEGRGPWTAAGRQRRRPGNCIEADRKIPPGRENEINST